MLAIYVFASATIAMLTINPNQSRQISVAKVRVAFIIPASRKIRWCNWIAFSWSQAAQELHLSDLAAAYIRAEEHWALCRTFHLCVSGFAHTSVLRGTNRLARVLQAKIVISALHLVSFLYSSTSKELPLYPNRCKNVWNQSILYLTEPIWIYKHIAFIL